MVLVAIGNISPDKGKVPWRFARLIGDGGFWVWEIANKPFRMRDVKIFREIAQEL
jgi:hypothetical protein